MTDTPSSTPAPAAANFIRDLVKADNEAGTFGGRVQTRFPPEPNGYLHIGHAKAICVDFGIAKEFGGICKLRFDDTNPVTEDTEYVDAIVDDIRWLGFEPHGDVVYASDYFEQLYLWAEHLIEHGFAYIDDQDAETISAQRGGYGKPGVESPYRDRTCRREPRASSAACAPATCPTARTCCAPRPTCSTRTCSCATR